MMHVVLSLLAIALTLLCIIGFHEFGHFIVAKLAGIKVLRFSIGFGKALYTWHDKSGTEYVIALIPLGGYVKLEDEKKDKRQSLLKQFLVTIAGPLANLLLAFVAYWIIFTIGFVTLKPIIGDVVPHSIAAKANLKPNQEIIAIDHKPTSTWIKIALHLLIHTGDKKNLSIDVKTKNSRIETHELDLTHWKLDKLKPDPLFSLGLLPPKKITPALLHSIRYSPLQAISHALDNVIDFSLFNLIVIQKIITGKMSLQSLGGPITIFSVAGAAFYQGIIPFLSFLAFLSISIGILNLLPIPGLDGGHLLFQGIELILRRPVSLRVQLLFYRLGMILIVLLIIQALMNDLLRL